MLQADRQIDVARSRAQAELQNPRAIPWEKASKMDETLYPNWIKQGWFQKALDDG